MEGAQPEPNSDLFFRLPSAVAIVVTSTLLNSDSNEHRQFFIPDMEVGTEVLRCSILSRIVVGGEDFTEPVGLTRLNEYPKQDGSDIFRWRRAADGEDVVTTPGVIIV